MSAGSYRHDALDFLDLIIRGKIDEAYAKHVGAHFKHHNPYFPADAMSLLHGMAASEKEFPNKLFEVQHVLADGDFVAVHSRLRFNTSHPGMAVVHLFRFEDGKIAEFWDVAQQQPDEMANELGMF